ncbi:MAG: hypothetical protein EP335_09035 [Alphaproteobacteria bacterium]|nr:MAG: hypothetical protein EP335_09035 [Alphaproteobacteria bacterium]
MNQTKKFMGRALGGVLALGLLAACATGGHPVSVADATSSAVATEAQFEADRKAILAMTGDYAVTFSFKETVAFQPDYHLKDAYETGAHEIVRVIGDTGRFISLQHILIVGGEERFPIKHWRQDWVYEPEKIFEYIGHNTWRMRDLSLSERKGKWAQLVYQVDDGPRYAALAAWDHTAGLSSWTSPATWRPLPRREATKRDDYDVMVAVNRHALTPTGWVHEQDNTKLVIGENPHVIARETGLNTYNHTSGIDAEVAENYWDQTKDYWARVRAEWSGIEAANRVFGLTIKGEPEPMYTKILAEAAAVKNGKESVDEAMVETRAILDEFVRKE